MRHGEVMFERVFSALVRYVRNETSEPLEPYECLVRTMMTSFCKA